MFCLIFQIEYFTKTHQDKRVPNLKTDEQIHRLTESMYPVVHLWWDSVERWHTSFSTRSSCFCSFFSQKNVWKRYTQHWWNIYNGT